MQENISRRNFIKMLGGVSAVGICGGFSLLKKQEETAAKLEKTEKSFVIKAKPMYKEVI